MNFNNSCGLVKLLQKRDIYLNYRKYIKTQLLGEIHKEFLDSFQIYFDKFDHDYIDTSQYINWFIHSFKPACDDSVIALYTTAWEEVCKASISVVEDIVIRFHAYATKEAILDHVELEDFNAEKIINMCQKHLDAMQIIQGQEDYVDFSDPELYDCLDRTKGLKFRLNCLNQSIGSLIKGDLVILGAYTEVGKTTWLASETSFMATQITDGCVLWLNNEERNSDVQVQLQAATLARPPEKIRGNHAVAMEYYKQRMNGDGNRIKVIDVSGKSIYAIEKMLKNYKAKLCIIDQADKLSGFEGDSWSDVQRLKTLYGKIRQLAKQYCPIICASQASAPKRNSDGELCAPHWLTPADLDSSKVGKPGEADIIIMLSKDARFPTTRYLTVCKNKVKGADPKYRHIQREIYYDPEKCQYLDGGQ